MVIKYFGSHNGPHKEPQNEPQNELQNEPQTEQNPGEYLIKDINHQTPEQYLQKLYEIIEKSERKRPIAFNPGVGPITLSGRAYAKYKTRMEELISGIKTNQYGPSGEKDIKFVNGRYHIKCNLLVPTLVKEKKYFFISMRGKFLIDFDEKLTWDNYRHYMRLKPDLMISAQNFMVELVEDGDKICINDIVESVSEERITSSSSSPPREAVPLSTLRSSLLKHSAVSIDNTGDQKQYQFFTVEDPSDSFSDLGISLNHELPKNKHRKLLHTLSYFVT